jgi:arginine exporter protein ArgO
VSTGLGDGSLPRTYATVVALTAVNPMTLLYFAALAVGLPALGGAAEGRIAFVAGVGLASAGWQLVLASVGALLHRRLPGRARLATGVAGNVVILLLAANILRAVLAGGAG